MDINLLENRVVVKRLKWEETTESGIHVRNEGKERLVRGKVLYVGPGKERVDGTIKPMKSKVGDIIYYGKALGIDFMLFQETYEVFKEDDAFFICNTVEEVQNLEDAIK